MESTSVHNDDRFTKKRGRKRVSPVQTRLTPQEHEAFRRLILGGTRASPGRLELWAKALNDHLGDHERVRGNPYTWLTYRLRELGTRDGKSGSNRPMLFADAAKIFRAGIRVPGPPFTSAAHRANAIAEALYLHEPGDWLTTVAREIPALHSYVYTEGIPGRLTGPYDRAFVPVMLPLEAIAPLAERLAEIVVERDRDGERRRKGEEIERYLISRVSVDNGAELAWNWSAGWAIENVVSRVLFKHYYRGTFGAHSDGLFSNVNELSEEIGRLFRIALAEPNPGAFDRLLETLGDDVEEERLRQKRTPTD